ncbi:unnamed protein product [Lactuca virosa]|uniref:Carbohydrate kinase FGGY N-terminal domain-containing protein n=1 Tax=Lactuca virosa TaxID=75947 RepID=A0AAU9MRN0_9ASTR|nr:unnamed protein product [Lactuca virosa]
MVTLSSLDPKKPLVDQFGEAFSTKESPIWMDSSTTQECKAIEKALGGALELSKLTRSRAHERYTGPQIKRIFEMQPQVYNNTERISLVSSFMASPLIGGYTYIDHTNGVGMNLMDIKERTWSKKVLEATAPGLEEKLRKLAPAHVVAGLIAPFQFNKECLVVQWSGDNLNCLADSSINRRTILFNERACRTIWYAIPSKAHNCNRRGSANRTIFSCIPSIFGCNVYTIQRPGAALRAAHGWVCMNKGSFVPISFMYKDKLEKTTFGCKAVATITAQDNELVAKYALFMKKRMEIKNRLVQRLGRYDAIIPHTLKIPPLFLILYNSAIIFFLFVLRGRKSQISVLFRLLNHLPFFWSKTWMAVADQPFNLLSHQGYAVYAIEYFH